MRSFLQTSISYKFLWLGSVVYGLLACYDLKEPGANYDEMLYAAPAVNFVTGIVNTEPMQINPSVVHLWGRPFPLMVMTYIGSAKVIWHILFFAVFGISIEVARFASVLMGVGVLMFTYRFLEKFLNRDFANAVIVMMAALPEWVFYSSRDMTVVMMMLCKMAALYWGWRFKQSGQTMYLSMAAVALGIGLYDKASFLWFLIALVCGIALWGRTELKSIPRRAVWTAIGWFLASASVFFLFNLIRMGEAFQPFITRFSQTDGGVNNFDVTTNFIFRVRQLITLFNGEGLLELFTGRFFTDAAIPVVLKWLLITCLIVGVLMIVFKKNMPHRQRLLFILFLFIGTFLQTIFSPYALTLHHVAIAWPFHLVLIAAALMFLNEVFKKRILLGIAVGVISISGIAANAEIYRELGKKGADGNWSESIYDLNDYLLQKRQPVVLLTWGFTNNLLVLSKGQLTCIRFYRELMNTAARHGVDSKENIIMKNLSKNYLYLESTRQSDEAKMLLMQAAMRNGYTIKLEKTFWQKDGTPIYHVYSLN